MDLYIEIEIVLLLFCRYLQSALNSDWTISGKKGAFFWKLFEDESVHTVSTLLVYTPSKKKRNKCKRGSFWMAWAIGYSTLNLLALDIASIDGVENLPPKNCHVDNQSVSFDIQSTSTSRFSILALRRFPISFFCQSI